MSATHQPVENFEIPLEAAEAYEERFVPGFFAQWAPVLCDAAGVTAGQRVVDVACGTGIVARTAAERVGLSGTVTGVDLERQVAFAPFVDMVAGLAGPEAVSLLGAYFACGDLAALTDLLAAAGLTVTVSRTEPGVYGAPSVAAAVATEIDSTPLRAPSPRTSTAASTRRRGTCSRRSRPPTAPCGHRSRATSWSPAACDPASRLRRRVAGLRERSRQTSALSLTQSCVPPPGRAAAGGARRHRHPGRRHFQAGELGA